jgi:N-acetylneuraminic acid mutarotase
MDPSAPVWDDLEAIELCEQYFESMRETKTLLGRLMALEEGQYGKQGAESIYELKHLRPAWSSVSSSSASSSSSSSSSSRLSVAGVQLTRLSQSCPQLAKATSDAQLAILNEIAKREADIASLSKEVLKLSDRISREGDEDGALLKQIGHLSMMKGKHLEGIGKLQALTETSVQVDVHRKCERVEVRSEEVISVKKETRLVPARKRKEEPPRWYVVGGFDGKSIMNSGIERFNWETKRWEALAAAPMASKREGLAGAVLNGRLYAIGGRDGRDCLRTVERFDEERESWEVLPAQMQKRHVWATAVALNGLLYVLGGAELPERESSFVERFDQERGRWELVAPMRRSRSGHATAVLDGKLYVIGGMGLGKICLKSVERYDPDRNVWENMADMNIVRDLCAAAVLDGKLYVTGGGVWRLSVLSSVEWYDAERNEWKTVSPMQRARWGHACVVVNGQLHVVGGKDNNQVLLSSVERYNAERDVWEMLEEGLQVPRDGHVSLVTP